VPLAACLVIEPAVAMDPYLRGLRRLGAVDAPKR
jgi:hypothetical protein